MLDHIKWLFPVGLVAIAAMMTSGQQASSEVPAALISVASFGPDNVIGLLGRLLGTVVRVTGVAIAAAQQASKPKRGCCCSRFRLSMDSRLRNHPQFLREPGDPDIQGWVSGDRFDFYCHEHGAFEGLVNVPKNLGLDEFPKQGVGFRYKSKIQINRRRQKK